MTALDDNVAEEHGEVELSHTVISADDEYDGIPIPNLRLTIRDDDAGGLFIDETDGDTMVVEGVTSGTDTYDVRLTHAPTDDVTVTLTFDTGDDGQLTLTDDMGNALPVDGSNNSILTFTSMNWSTAQTVLVTAVDDGVAEASHGARVIHTLSSIDPDFNERFENDDLSMPQPIVFELDVDIVDQASVLITQTNESTFVVSGATDGRQFDTYEVVLTSSPTSDVTITVQSDALSTVSTVGSSTPPIQLVFTADVPDGMGGTIAGNWDVPQEVTVTAQESPDVNRQELSFLPAEQQLSTINGPLTLFGGLKQGTNRTLAATVFLPSESDRYVRDGEIDAINSTSITLDPDDTDEFNATAADIEDFPGITYLGILDTDGQIRVSRAIQNVIGMTFELVDPFEPGDNVAVDDDYVVFFRSRTLDAVEADQIDVANLFDTLRQSGGTGTLTDSRVTGFGMPATVPIGGTFVDGGITYHDLEVVELFLGKGADTLTVESTAAQRIDGSITNTVIHGGGDGDTITVEAAVGRPPRLVVYGDSSADLGRYIHFFGSDNTGQQVSGSLSITLDSGNSVITRPDDDTLDWADEGFAVGQLVRVEVEEEVPAGSETTLVAVDRGDFEVIAVDGTDLTVSGDAESLIGMTSDPIVTVSVVDASRRVSSTGTDGVNDTLTDVSADFTDVVVSSDLHIGILDQPQVLAGTLTADAFTEKVVTRLTSDWFGTLTTGDDLSSVAEIVYGRGLDAFVGILDGGGGRREHPTCHRC